jgi:adenine-specific DNA-methyltransferase
MSDKLNQLTNKLKELFQLNRPDLDFGIYRIMHAKQAEIERFLDKDLLPQVKEGLAELGSGKQAEIKAEIDEAIKQAEDLGVEKPEETKKVKELRAKYGSEFSEEQAEDEIYSHLYNFFARYYQDGDFMSMRRYKEGVYAIPYEGEEVYLHWANKDQYYIKTSENLKNYTFKLDDGRKVTFRILEADTEKDNKKAADDKDRRFILNADSITQSDDGQILVMGFEYRPDDKKRNQTAINEDCVAQIQSTSSDLGAFATGLLSLRPTDKRKDRTLLEKHLEDYTAKHTFDYFIHKDLGKFLRRELDFYIKNEVMHLDDIEHEAAQRVEQYLTKVKVIRRIAGKIIDFLAQLEDFQKKLWLKKKFVVETNYCITLDRVPEELYPEIAKNAAQWEEWEKLGFLENHEPKRMDTNRGELDLGDQEIPAIKTVEYLKAFPFMVIDTRFYTDDFLQELLASVDDFDEQCDGLLIHSENFQALNVLHARYKEQIQCVHIDPPYNTASSGFLYKNNYVHSSWLSFMLDRSLASFVFLRPGGVFACHIDEYEMETLNMLLDQTCLTDAGTLVWDKGMPIAGANGLATQHEYVLFRSKGTASIRVKKKNVELIHAKIKQLLREYGAPSKEAISEYRKWLRSSAEFSKSERTYDQFDKTGKAFRSDNMSATDQRENEKFYVPLSHPVTGKACPVPKFGWRYTPDTIQKLLDEDLILFGENETGMPRKKTYLENTADSQMATIFRSGARGKSMLDNLHLAFPFAHAVEFYCHIVDSCLDAEGIVLDYFGGSGTTAHSVIELNRQDDGSRKYLMVEMGDHFDSVLRPRIQKVIFSPVWKDGKPEASSMGISHCFKYIRLESYEDCLNNLKLSRSSDQDELLLQHDDLREDYMLNYMLDVEAKGSVLNIDAFEDPFAYKMNIATGTVGETRPVTVDLVETFNYLIGLKVKHIDNIRGVRVITGENLAGDRILVLWRKTKEMDSNALDEWFTKQGYNTQDMEFDLIYVNGDNNLENLKKDEHTWKVRLIEEEFQRLMFEEVE